VFTTAAPAATATTASAVPPLLRVLLLVLLLPFGLFCKVLCGNTLVAFFSTVVLETAVPADDCGFLWWEDPRGLIVLSDNVGLDGVRITKS